MGGVEFKFVRRDQGRAGLAFRPHHVIVTGVKLALTFVERPLFGTLTICSFDLGAMFARQIPLANRRAANIRESFFMSD